MSDYVSPSTRPAAYPSDLEVRLPLEDGRTVLVRPVVPDDAPFDDGSGEPVAAGEHRDTVGPVGPFALRELVGVARGVLQRRHDGVQVRLRCAA